MATTYKSAGPRRPTTPCRTSLDGLKHRLSALLEVLPADRPLVYLDYPVYLNFGDLLIMRGSEQFFAEHARRIVARFAYMNFLNRAASRVTNAAILVLHGGGNFGDLYPVHQSFREEVIRRFPDNRIIMLPQSVHFSSEAELERSARIFRQHRDLTLYVRDHDSMDQLRGRFTQRVLLSPDMSHQLWRGPPAPASTPGRTLELMRKDIEISEQQQQVDFGTRALDWLDFNPRWSCRIFGRLLWLHNLEGKLGCELGARALWYGYCATLHRHMESRIREYDEVITSRLHGMLFALLLGKRVRYFDNVYGKLGGYARTWFDASVQAKPYYVIRHSER